MTNSKNTTRKRYRGYLIAPAGNFYMISRGGENITSVGSIAAAQVLIDEWMIAP